MTLSFLYGSTLWIATSVASAQLAFPGTLGEAAKQLADRVATRASAASVVAEKESVPTSPAPTCPYCDGGHCIVCGQAGFRMDGESGALSYGIPVFDEPCYAPPAGAVSLSDNAAAPKATEPDDLPAETEVAAAVTDEADASADAEAVVEDDNSDAPRLGLLSRLSAAVDRAADVFDVRARISAGVVEASRAWELSRQWLASCRAVATVEPAPARSEATQRLHDWFAGRESPGLETAVAATAAEKPAAEESPAQPAVTKAVVEPAAVRAPAPVAEIDSLVPAEAFASPVFEAAEEVDWEAILAEAYLDRLRAEQERQVAAEESARADVPAADAESADPRQDVITPTLRTAAAALEQVGQAAIELSNRLRTMTDARVRR